MYYSRIGGGIMKLYIIGNGFDIGHGLPTTYWDFRTYLNNLYPLFLEGFEEHYYIYPNMAEEEKQELLWNEFETNLANINEDVIIENALNFDMGLESGDIGIEDTLYQYFSEEYSYINLLAKYLKQWIRTIKIRDIQKRTTLIKNESDSVFISFNYTAVLERIYKIDENRIIHIHGSLRQKDGDPILGHGNKRRIEDIKDKKNKAEVLFDEKAISICKVVEDYYNTTFKNVGIYTNKLLELYGKTIDEITVIGHSLSGVDMLYFKNIEMITRQKAIWKLYYHKDEEREKLYKNLRNCNIKKEKIIMLQTSEFYDL